MRNHYESKDDILALIEGFEACSFHPSEFKHHQHLTVALWYVSHLPYDAAAEKMKTGIQRLAASYGKTGYHETITLFWLRLVRNFLARTRQGTPIDLLANQLIDKYTDKNLILAYYSADLLASAKAKREWVEPDLKSLGF